MVDRTSAGTIKVHREFSTLSQCVENNIDTSCTSFTTSNTLFVYRNIAATIKVHQNSSTFSQNGDDLKR